MVDESLIAYLKSKLITYYETESTLFHNESTFTTGSQWSRQNRSQTELDTPGNVMLSDEKEG